MTVRARPSSHTSVPVQRDIQERARTPLEKSYWIYSAPDRLAGTLFLSLSRLFPHGILVSCIHYHDPTVQYTVKREQQRFRDREAILQTKQIRSRTLFAVDCTA